MWERFRRHTPRFEGLEILKYIGPGFLVAIGFIDPGNWAANMAAGSRFGYALLWMITLSTVMLIVLQRNAARLGIVTGLCISEASAKYFKRWISIVFMITAMIAAMSTALAELLGAAIGLNMLFGFPLIPGSILVTMLVFVMIVSNSYKKLERWMIGFVSLIGLCFLYELQLIDISWTSTFTGWIQPAFPIGSIPILLSVLGAVVMPHNLFLHSEIIQSRRSVSGETVVPKHLKYEFFDTMFAMIIGWAINSAMIIAAAAIFYSRGIEVTELSQAHETLQPLLGHAAANIFGFALLCAGIASAVTAALAGGSIFAGVIQEPYNIKDIHSKIGVILTLAGGLLAIFFLSDPFQGLIWSQIALSVQLPWTIIALLILTSSKKIMGNYANSNASNLINWSIAGIVILLNVMLLVDSF
ncbi:MAG: natural resistance-associated macrophage protein [Parachlamydiales bacterium]|nr:natural resistance-associated macrophage protein [Parachlamydiales bacterium]